MAAAKPLAQHHPKPFHKHHHLLYQFILSETIIIFSAISKLQIDEEKWNLPESELKQLLFLLTGTNGQYMRLFQWNQEGYLSKLKNYCLLFHQGARESEDKAQEAMLKEADKALSLSLDILEMTQVPQYDASIVGQLFAKIIFCLQRIVKAAIKILPEYKEDENVIFFLIRHREQLDALCGVKFIGNLFRQLYPESDEEPKNFLIKKYSERGFHHLTHQIMVLCQ